MLPGIDEHHRRIQQMARWTDEPGIWPHASAATEDELTRLQRENANLTNRSEAFRAVIEQLRERIRILEAARPQTKREKADEAQRRAEAGPAVLSVPLTEDQRRKALEPF